MAFLQAKSQMRAGHQRTQGELPFGQDSHQQLSGQLRSLPSGSVGLRLGAMVQASVSAGPMEILEPANDSYRALGLAGASGLLWRRQRTQDSPRLYSSQIFPAGFEEYRAAEDSQNRITLSKIDPTLSSSSLLKHGASPFFQV